MWKAARVNDEDDEPVAAVAPWPPPAAPRRPVTFTNHGDQRTDDWYWLRDRSDAEVLELLLAENAHTSSSTAHLEPLVEAIYDAVLSRVQLTDVSHPSPKGEWAYYERRIEGEEHPVLCRRPAGAPLPQPSPEADDELETVLLDENAMAAGHDYFSVGMTALSADQRLLAYGVDLDGGERLTIHVRDLDAGEDLPDVIENAYYGLAFARDDSFFYTRPDAAMRPHQVWRHRLGAAVSSDTLVWEEPDERFYLDARSTKDGEYVVLQAGSHATTEVRLVPASSPDSAPLVLEARRQGVMYWVEHLAGELLVLSNEEAENFALYRLPAAEPTRANRRLFLPPRDDVRLETIDVVDGHVLVEERGHATTSIRIVPIGEEAGAGGAGGDSALPGRVITAPEAGTVFLADNLDVHATSVRYEATTLVMPRTLRSYELDTGSDVVLRRQPTPGYDPDDYETELRWARSGDGTEVPVTIARSRARPDGPGPLLLYGYGAYELSVDPSYRDDRPIHPLLDRGVAYAIAHVRGGGELGRNWYLGGKLANKPHSFEDFVASARFLVDEGLTSPDRLVAQGGSAGGLLMGASANLAPELFAGVVAEVPFVDCLTTMLDISLPLTVIEQEEWGDPIASAEDYEVIRSYAPYDNVREEPYPRTLATGGLTDPRVGYFEPAKWVQKLRAAHPGNAAPGRVLLRVDMTAGHRGPSGRYQHWRKQAFVMAFVLETLGADLRPAGGHQEAAKISS